MVNCGHCVIQTTIFKGGMCQAMKPKVKICKSCRMTSSTPLFKMKNERCYTCRKIAHETPATKKMSFLVPAILGAISLYFLMLSIRSVYFQHAVLSYRGRGRGASYEFTGVAIILPALSFTMIFIGSLALTLACYDKRHKKTTYIKIITGSLFSGVVLHVAAIFFGDKMY